MIGLEKQNLEKFGPFDQPPARSRLKEMKTVPLRQRSVLFQIVQMSIIAILICLIAGTATQARPNIVLIVGDDQAWSDYGFMEHPFIRTPNLDRLASESLVYRYGYVPSSLCRPSLATMLTGLYPHQHRITGNDPSRPEGMNSSSPEYLRRNERLIGLIEESPTLPRLLGSVGYRSFQAGKWWEGHFSRGGFTHGMTHGDPARGGRHGDDGLRIGRDGLQPLFDFVEASKSAPFFIWYAPFLPHTPHEPPERLLAKYLMDGRPIELSRYYAMCEWFDETVGELLGRLEGEGLLNNTLIIFVADNGWVQRTHEMNVPSGWDFNFAPRSKRSAYDTGIRSPVIVHWSGRVEPESLDVPVSSIDLAPTILKAAGLKPTQQMPGVNLLDRSAVFRRKLIFGDIYTHDVMDPLNPVASLKYRWCIRRPWKLIVPHSPNIQDAELQLFDLFSDPHETRNWAPEKPQLVDELYREIQRWWEVD